MKTNVKYLILILVLALVLRSVFIGTNFSGDAIDTVGPARNFVETGVAAVYYTTEENVHQYSYQVDGVYFNYTHPPMRVLLYSLWASLVGFSNATMILLPIIFGLLSILFIYMLGKELYSEKVGLLAALLASVVRYHIYASVIGFGDNFLMFTLIASLYFFLRYLKTSKYAYFIPVVIFTALGFLTKLAIFAMIPTFFIIAFLYRDKIKMQKSFLLIIITIALSLGAVYFSYPITEYLTGVTNDQFNFFDSYIGLFLTATPSTNDFLAQKSFYLMSFIWQFTPFFSALVALSLLMKRDRSYWFLTAWFIVAFLSGMSANGQDFQRYMVIAIAPAIILVAKYLGNISTNYRKNYAGILAFIGVFLLAVLVSLNDMLPYYEPWKIGLFILFAVPMAMHKERKQLLLGASVALSIFFLIGTSFLVSINSSVVQQMTDEVGVRGYPYNELWTTRDVSMYLAPEGEMMFLQRAAFGEDFATKNNVKYFAFYSIYREDDIIDMSRLCKDEPFFATANGRRVGLVCEM